MIILLLLPCKTPTINYLIILIRVWYLTLIKQLCKGSFTLMRQGHVKSVYFVFCYRHSANITTCCHRTHFFDGRSRHMIGCRFYFMTTLNDGKNYFLLSYLSQCERVLISIRNRILLSIHYCVNYLLHIELYRTKQAHSHLPFGQLLHGLKSSIKGFVQIFFAIVYTKKSMQ